MKVFLKQKLETSTAFRALSKNFSIVMIVLNINFKGKPPSHTTIINWVHKIGYYELTRPKEKAEDWIIILDHSIQMGNDKILVILGIREKNIDFSRPLRFQDLVPLREITKKKWNGDLIKDILEDLQEEIGTIKYAVSDHGSDIKNGLRLTKITNVYDLTHKIASLLRNLYEKDEIFNEFTTNISKMRLKLAQSKLAYLVPTVQRKKARYQNIKSISDWAIKFLNYLNQDTGLSNEEKTELVWISNYAEYIYELGNINSAINKIEKIIKHRGLSKATARYSIKQLKKLTSKKGIFLKEKLEEYFTEILSMFSETKKMLCTSDIIESAFGKYKNYASANPLAGITNLALCISAFTSKLQLGEIKKALEKTTIMDIKAWTKEFIGETLIQKRRHAFAIS